MNPLLYFLSHTRLWILPAGIIWIVLLALQNDQGYFQYQMVDAAYYQELAQDFISGKPMVLDGLYNEKGNSFSPYPPGYPVLLGVFQWLTGNSSWLNHVLLHGCLGLILLLIWQSGLSMLPLAFVFFSDTVLSLAASGISEFSFLIFVIFTVFSFSKLEIRNQLQWQIGLAVSLCLSIWVRYSAVFLILFLFLKIWGFYQSSPKKATAFIWPSVYFLLFLLILFLSQWLETDLISGGDRYPNSDSITFLLKSLIIETFNQILIFRNISGASLLSAATGILICLAFLFFIIRIPFSAEGPGYQASDENHPVFLSVFSGNLLLAGFCYLMFMIPIRWYYYFAESYDNRLLGPGFSLLLLGWAVKNEESLYRQPLWIKLAFLFFAIAFFLPDSLIKSV